MNFCLNLLFLWAYSTQILHPHQNSQMSHPGMSTCLRNDSHCLKLWHLTCSLITNTPSKVPILAVLVPVKSTAQKFRNFLPAYTCSHQFTSFCFKSGQNWQRIKWPKVRVVLVKKNKTHFGILRYNLWAILPNSLCDSAP